MNSTTRSRYDVFLSAYEGDVSKVFNNHIVPEGINPEGCHWVASRLTGLQPKDVLTLLKWLPAEGSPSLSEEGLVDALAAMCPQKLADQQSYALSIVHAAEPLGRPDPSFPPSRWGAIIVALNGRIDPMIQVGLLAHGQLECCEAYDRLRRTIPWHTGMKAITRQDDALVHPAAALFVHRHDDSALRQGLSELWGQADAATRVKILAVLEQAEVLDLLNLDAVFPEGSLAHAEASDAKDREDAKFYLRLAWNLGKKGNAQARTWFVRRVAATALARGSWDATAPDLREILKTNDEWDEVERDVLQFGVPEEWVHPDPWSIVLNNGAMNDYHLRRRRLWSLACKVEQGLPPDPARIAPVWGNEVPYLLEHLPLPETQSVEFVCNFVELTLPRLSLAGQNGPSMALRRLAPPPVARGRANLLVEIACKEPWMFALPEFVPILEAADPISPTDLRAVLKLDAPVQEAALCNLGRHATDAFGSRLDERAWTAHELLETAAEKLSAGSTQEDVVEAMRHRLSTVARGDPELPAALDWLEAHGLVGKALFALALPLVAEPLGADRQMVAWLARRLRTVNALNEHGKAAFTALAGDGMGLFRVVMGILEGDGQPRETSKILQAMKMAFGKFLILAIRQAFEGNRKPLTKGLLRTLGTLLPPAGISKSVAALRHLAGEDGELRDLVEACTMVVRRPDDASEIGDVQRSLEELSRTLGSLADPHGSGAAFMEAMRRKAMPGAVWRRVPLRWDAA